MKSIKFIFLLSFFFLIFFTLFLTLPDQVLASSIGVPSNKLTMNSGLVGWWTFDGEDVVNGVIRDKSGNGNHGNPINIATSTFYDVGKVGQGGRFDGVNDYVSVSDGGNVFTSGYSSSFWFNKPSSGVQGIILGQWGAAGAGNASWAVTVEVNNKLNVAHYNTTDGTNFRSDTVTTINTNKWYHVVSVYDGSNIYFYVNGSFSSSGSIGAEPQESNYNIWIGDSFTGLGNFNGSLDDVRIYNRALSASEVSQLYNSTAGSKVSASQPVKNRNCTSGLSCGLVGYWTFDGKDIVNGVIRDKSGNGNHGNAINIATSTFYDVGKVGQAGRFDGGNDYLRISSDITFGDSVPWTFSTWMNWNGVVSGNNSFTGLGGTFKYLGVVDSGYKRFVYREGAPNYTVRYFSNNSSVSAINKWQYITIMSDGQGTLSLYKDGVYSEQITSLSTTAIIFRYIGIGYGPTSGLFGGSLDDIRIYNRALSASEVSQLYNSTAGSKVSASQPVKNRNCTSGLSCGLVGYWTFDGKDVVNGVIRDKSGQGNHGNAINIATSTFYDVGKVGQAGRFDGGDDRVTIPHSSVYNTSEITISFWVNPKGVLTQRFIEKTEWIIRFEQSAFCVEMVKTIFFDAPACASAANKWTHFAFTGDATNYTWYKNGVQVIQTAQAWVAPTGTDNLILGGTSDPYSGSLDDVRIYNRALSAREVLELYNMGR